VLNIMLPLLERMVDGAFHQQEADAAMVPFKVNEEELTNIVVDGIYPKFSRFVKGIKEPITPQEMKYTGWQEAFRKDVESAFGVLKGTGQFLHRPILLHKLPDISLRATCSIKTAGQHTTLPTGLQKPWRQSQPHDLNQVQQIDPTEASGAGGIGVANAP
jgi:hypothetical protein